MEVTLGGDRLGSGNKQKQELHNYNRATFNQEQDWKSSMAPGVLYPFLCIPMTNGDSMDIDLDAFVRTLPTKGPLFGSFKLQADIFSVPMRLYNGILHNNPIDIGLKMKDIYFPKLKLEYGTSLDRVQGNDSAYTWQVHPTSLLKYLGLSGIGLPKTGSYVLRKINAVPALAYYDIFKNYYANKQEENAYVITPGTVTKDAYISEISTGVMGLYDKMIKDLTISAGDWFPANQGNGLLQIVVKGDSLNASNIVLSAKDADGEEVIDAETLYNLADDNYIKYDQYQGNEIRIVIFPKMFEAYSDTPIKEFMLDTNSVNGLYASNIYLRPFKLKNIDDMRNVILSTAVDGVGREFVIAEDSGEGDWNASSGLDGTGLPYSALVKYIKESSNFGPTWNSFTMNGLCVKTYQSDIFNNWIQTDWIEGENGIAALSAVSVSNGSFQIDALNLAEKVYNMLNRVALSGGTYEDWQEAVFTQDAVRKAETPIYEGGMSAEVMFEEVISTAETAVDGDPQALGSLGGRGSMIGQKGGKNIHIRAKEPIFVMGIVSLTPRICYTQGNEWYLTELNSYDDLHKPAFDQIGFQDLILEQMAWWDTKCSPVTPGVEGPTYERHSAGKIVAWSNYMTAVDKAFGDFATAEGKGFMVLSRNYQYENREVKDVTTYIDPAKFNYAFAYSKLDAQNFWVQIHSKVITRRVMSAHQIPNL